MKHILDTRDIAFCRRLIMEAGATALAMQKTSLTTERKADRSIVTAADHRVQDMLLETLIRRYPGVRFIHEEKFDREGATAGSDDLLFIIDPIDGTAMYSMGLPIWAISMGIFHGDRPLYGFIFAPGADLFFHNDDDHAYCNDGIISVDPDLPVDSETNVFYASEMHGMFTIDFPGKVRNIGSTALQAVLVADNRRNRTLAFLGKSWVWDWAGAVPVVLKAGGAVTGLDGKPFSALAAVKNGCRVPGYLVSHGGLAGFDPKTVFRPCSG